MLCHLSKYIKKYFLFIFLIPSSSALASDFYMACYYYDTNRGENSNNPSLMRPSTAIPGAASNYFWATNITNNEYVKLQGRIIDGFFYAEDKSYEEAKAECLNAINKGTFFWRSKKSYKLYDIKASISNYNAYEYPIRFLKDDNSKGKIKQIVLFGDSLSDTGNLKRWMKVMPAYPFWYGRFSDGFIWNDYLKRIAHLPILNFAFGGAKTEGNNNFYVKDFLDYLRAAGRNIVTGSSRDYVNNYVNNYLTNDSYSNKSFKITNPDETLFIVWVGANDYISKFEQTVYSEDFFKYPDGINGSRTISERAVNNIRDQISTLISRGAKNFLVMNLPDFGKTPITLNVKYDPSLDDVNDKREFSQNISEVIKYYNAYLATSLNNLRISTNGDVNINLLDFYTDFNLLLEGKNIYTQENFDYGFTNLDSKYEIPNEPGKYIQDYCYKGSYLDAAKNALKTNHDAYLSGLNKSCKNSEKEVNQFAIFWNSPHPTSYAHCWISFLVLNKLEDLQLLPNYEFSDLSAVKNYCQKQINL